MTDDTQPTSEISAPAEQDEPRRSLKSYLSKAAKTLFSEFSSDDLRGQLEQAVGQSSDQNDDEADQQRDGFSAQERLMIANILRFGSLRVEDVMVPRADIEAIEESASLKELLTHFETIGHSRLPVYRDTLDDPTGMVHVKDLLRWIAEEGEAASVNEQKPVELKVISGGREAQDLVPEITDGLADGQPAKNSDQFTLTENQIQIAIKDANILRDVLYVPPSMPVVNLLLRMQSTRVHLALVVDEYGGTDGLVSIEDLVEEVVGEIEDEHDDNNGQVISGNLETGITASARTSISDLEEKIGIDLFSEEMSENDIDTIGGLVFYMVGRVPVRGEIITHPNGLEIEVLSADPRRIKTLKIRKKIITV